ncbi:CAP domain-containing protein [Ornithinibacillus contaminans]|uniref:CAP domain-containing protein n=1 Tax=Ornithinibacillus contaminans TaxID=694055 RepID=UPI00064DDD2B|nr:CAP domain-containing protein [Ornithinibacillus contaminans]
MRFIRGIIVFIVVAACTFYIIENDQLKPDDAIDKIGQFLTEKKNELIEKPVPENIMVAERFSGDLFQWIGEDSEVLLEELGEPKRKDLSSYGYTWWVYTNGTTQYIQFGVLDGLIQTIYATGEDSKIEPLQIGESSDKVREELQFENEVTYSEGISSYIFQLEEEDMAMRPLAKITDEIFIQTYFDTFTDQLSSVRIMTADILLRQRPFGLSYRGNLPEAPDLSNEEWEQVESGMEQQIFDITNVIRSSFQKDTLTWEDSVSEVAFLHSKDMAENNYFSHYSLNGYGLKERLEEKNVSYFAAGENIAAQYVDAPAAVEGWLNSEGHREALLHDDYTHLGVGVYRLYYTQNFLTKPF